MQCSNPRNYNRNGVYIPHIPPCGKCLSCLTTTRHQWASRLLLERKAHSEATFFTLTFRPEDLPESHDELKPAFQKFMKRLRTNTGSPYRYFTCMEYGSQFGRPHYHGIFFGRKVSLEKRVTENGKQYLTDPVIEDNWQNGSTYSKDCPSSGQGMNIARYVANYILKNKWNSADSNEYPEWALQSRRPYIGQPAVKHLTAALVTRQGARHCAILGTIPDKFKTAGKTWKIPLRIRREIGAELDIPIHTIPPSDGTVIEINKLEVRNEIPHPIITYQQAQTAELRLKRRIRQLRRTNPTPETG